MKGIIINLTDLVFMKLSAEYYEDYFAETYLEVLEQILPPLEYYRKMGVLTFWYLKDFLFNSDLLNGHGCTRVVIYIRNIPMIMKSKIQNSFEVRTYRV